MNHLILHSLLPDLRSELLGKQITKAAWLEPVLSIGFSNRAKHHLIGFFGDPGPFCYIAPDDPIETCDPKHVFVEAIGATVAEVSLPEFDRIIQIHLSSRHHNTIRLSLAVYGSRGGAALARDDSLIGSIGAAPNQALPLPEAARIARPLAFIQAPELELAIKEGSASLDRIPGLEQELLDAFALPSGRIDTGRLIQFRDEMLRSRCSFFLGVKSTLAHSFPLPHRPHPADTRLEVIGPFSNGRQACAHIGERLLRIALRRMIDRRSKPVRKRLASREALRSRLLAELKTASEHSKLRKETEALAAYQTQVSQGASRVELPDPYDPESTVTIDLDPSAPLQDQIQKRFKKASKLERSVRRIEQRLRDIEGQLESLQSVLAAVEETRSFADAIRLLEESLVEHGIPRGFRKAGTARELERTYRRYDLDSMWFVLVGRNNRENDEITFHIAGPDDWWLHAQNVPGSHVVLKSKGAGGNPPAKILESAAGIAAYYSRARHASLVPVIYTRRKYVRKPRKAPPGKVQCEREKTIFAEPVLPHTENRFGK